MTTITLEQPGTAGPPVAALRAPGAHVIVGIVDVTPYQQRTIEGDPLTWADGTPKMGKAITGLVVSAHNTARGTENKQPSTTDVQPGDLVRFYAEKGRHYTWKDAVDAHGTVNVGDVMKWERLDDKPPTNRAHNPQKVYKATLRAPKASDGDLVDRCVAAHQALKQRPSLDQPAPAGVSAATSGWGDDDLDAF